MYKHLTYEQRYTIAQLLRNKISIKDIANIIDVNLSTIYREISRNGRRAKKHIYYNGYHAQDCYETRKFNNHGNTTIDINTRNKALKYLIEEQWSPEQISNYLRINENINISHETIYKIIREDKQNNGNLWKYCHHKMRYRHKIKSPKKPTKATNIPNRTSIHLRPKEANGKRFGDWELDTIVGKGRNNYLITLCEKSTNYLIIKKINTLKPKIIAKEIVDLLLPFKNNVLSITTDNGIEFKEHQYITKKIGSTVFFTDSYSSWQKGAIENANKLIRFYLPKGTDFKSLTDEDILKIQYKLNRRPRRRLNFLKPKDLFFQTLTIFALRS